MKKLLILFLAFTLNSCNDGNFDVPAFEFTETVNKCGSYVLYLTNTQKTEVLVLTLPSTALGSTPTVTLPISATVAVTYRIFDKAIGTDYFCQGIPPLEPKILKELKAKADEGGTINIVSTEILTNSVVTGHDYKINISKLLLTDGNEVIYHENFAFGTFQIKN